MEKRLYRSRTDRMISGVCGGIAEYFAIDPTIVRLATAALLLVTSGAVILVYIVMAIVVPETPAEGESDSPRAMTTEEISASAQGFGRDIQVAANKAVGGAAGAAGAAGVVSGDVPADATSPAGGVEEHMPPEAQPAPAPPAAPASDHRSGGTGAVLVGVLLIAFGLLVFVQRTLGFDLLSMSWRLFVPGVIILLGVLILIRAMRKA